MNVDGQHFRSIWLEQDGWSVGAIDQRRLPHEFAVARIASVGAAADAIRSMLVRGAPLIGATAAYGVALAMRADGSDASLDEACRLLIATRPTAINLQWALDEMQQALRSLPSSARAEAAYGRAGEIAEEDVRSTGNRPHGLALIEEAAASKNRAYRLICDSFQCGGLPTVDWGRDGADLLCSRSRPRRPHLGRRNRPRNQGVSLTAWELGHHGVSHTVIPDNTGGHLDDTEWSILSSSEPTE